MHILRFQVQNFRSLRDECELSFVSTSQGDEPEFRIHSAHAEHGVLPVLGIWGANASGKTNLVKALLAFREHVAKSFSLRPGQAIPWTPFALARDADAPPTRFSLDFAVDGQRYQYGFSHTQTEFLEEWLHAWPNGRQQRVFHRGRADSEPWLFGAGFVGRRTSLVEQTRANALFLSTAAQLNHELLTRVFWRIVSGIRASSDIELNSVPLFRAGDPIVDPARRDRVEKALRAIDVGCVGVEVKEVKIELPAELLERLGPEIVGKLRGQLDEVPRQLVLRRAGAASQTWSLPPEYESAGTSVMLRRINDFMGHEHGVLVIDEIDNSLHPDLVSAMVAIYTTEATNPAGRQLVFTAHDRDLLGALRRDEILIAEKDRNGATRINAVSDYRGIRRDRVSLRELHAAGQIGGNPILGDLAALVTMSTPPVPYG